VDELAIEWGHVVAVSAPAALAPWGQYSIPSQRDLPAALDEAVSSKYVRSFPVQMQIEHASCW
jgi:hypothetical protein